MQNCSFRYEGTDVPFVLIRKNVKNINLRIRSDSTVVVSAGSSVPYEFIEQVLLKRAPWIIKKIKVIDQKRSSAHKYISGEIIYYLGRQYILQVIAVKEREEYFLNEDQAFLFVKDPGDFVRKEELVKQWYKEEAEAVFKRSLDRVYLRVAGYGIKKPSVTIRTMKTRWGSCSFKKHKISLSTELLKYPPACIEYVVLHELAHFKHRKHDAAFYDFLTEIMPDWKEWKAKLKALEHKTGKEC